MYRRTPARPLSFSNDPSVYLHRAERIPDRKGVSGVVDYDARSSEARVDPLPAGPWFADLGQVQGEGGMAIGFASDR